MPPNPSLRSRRGRASAWVPDNRDGTYKNPILFADYSDPDVIRVGDDFYLTASSFNCVPALPILHSKDLVNWTIIGHAVERLPDRFDTVQHGSGIWAPSIRYHDEWFRIFVGDPDWGILMTKTKNPAGPWEPLHVVHEGEGLIDPCPLWDDDGDAYLVHAWAKSRAGINSILTVHKMSPDGKRLLDDGTMVFDGRNGVAPIIEGSKLHKRNGLYYILAPAGGVEEGWQLALRSKNPFGPYEAKRVLEQGSTNINGPHQGAWAETQSGESWFIHFQNRGAYGRIVHLQPVNWVDDWPLMGVDADGNGVGEPVTTHRKPNVGKTNPVVVPQTSDEFDGNKLGLQWQWQANPKPEWYSLTARPGWLRLNAVARPLAAANNIWTVPNQLLQKIPAPRFTATAKLEFNPRAESDATGLVVMGEDYGALMVCRSTAGFDVKRVTCQDTAQGNAETVDARVRGPVAAGLPSADGVSQTRLSLRGKGAPVKGAATGKTALLSTPVNPIWLRVSVEPEALCTFSYSADGKKFTVLGSPFPARAGRWIGAKVGLVCLGTGGHADFDWFRVW
ncbi:MAG TPA: glycoside hydrolase 43 family protein [Verrucomicrobiae bacterium]|nr:glycoside hydrolase 43 family protein [Verrucomicrobiae bacterium]